jgi:predicted CxxxxCH...CXXCH cytochrome family protein
MAHRLLLVTLVTLLVGCGDLGRHHPDGFGAGALHGAALKQQTEDCRTCHGADLTGGTDDDADAPSCDSCHDPVQPTAWRSDCTFCHGGVENDTGAPPRNLDGTDQVGPFPVHTIHVTGSALANAYDCNQCHTKAIDVLSPGHVFDDTPGEAENDYGNGLSPQTSFALADRTCSNNYCHGDGRADNGTIAAQQGPVACDGCHAVATGNPAGWAAMSGGHPNHLAIAGVSCADCHAATTTDSTSITDVARHIDGARDVAFTTPGFAFDASAHTCTGSCHSYDHNGAGWVSGTGGSPHPAGFSAPTMHGPEMELQRSDCRGCHGADLTGGIGPSCDSCHTAGWRDDCTFCHGGGLDDTGAPPRDLGSTVASAAQSFVAHPRHVTQGIAAASDCIQCHVKPTDVMSLNHAFDSTHGTAENVFTGGRSPATTYDANGTCANNYCHGNGRAANGSYRDGLGPVSCASCHAGRNSGGDAWQLMSGDHKKHLEEGFSCEECHETVSGTGGTTVIAPLLHVDGQKQVDLKVTTITYNPATRRCTGPCHGEDHNETW